MKLVASLRRRAADCAALLALPVIAFLLTMPVWSGPVQWTPDGVFYQAKVLQLHGMSEQAALDRVLASPIGQELQQREAAQGEPPRLRDPAWVRYESQFFERRWLVPVLAAAVEPAFGDRALEVVTLAGYVACGMLLFLLLRLRFSTILSFAGAALALSLSPLTFSASHPLTDTVALALVIAATIAAVRLLQRGFRWLPLWLLALGALAFTREAGIVVVVGALGAALGLRNRRAVTLAASGAALVSLPMLATHVSLLDQMAFALNNYLVPAHTSLSQVLAGLPGGVATVVRADVVEPTLSGQPSVAAMVFLVGTAALVLARGDHPLLGMLRWMAPAAVVFGFLSPAPTALRLFLPLVPATIFGVLLVAERVLTRWSESRQTAAPAAAMSS